MGYVERLLGRNERIVFVTRQHWIVLLGSMIGNLLLALLIAAVALALYLVALTLELPAVAPFAWLLLVLLVIPIVRFALRFLNWWNEQYIVTNRRVIQTEGVFNKHVIDSSLEKVNDVVLTQSAWGRMLGYGDVEILTASEFGANRFERIAGPVHFKTEMLNQKEGLGELEEFRHRTGQTLEGPPSAAGDIPELIAELDELRRRGVISDQEFQQKKQELLRKI
jgi:uncharacterized membrane protein YdbT with pleckstrin-like domain